MDIKIKYLTDITPIEKITIGDWIDLRVAEDIILEKGDRALVRLGIVVKLPEGYEAYIAPRSSTFKKHGILSPDMTEIALQFGIIQTNYPYGVIDESYCGNEDEWRFPVLALRDTKLFKDDRICQFRIFKKMEPVNIIQVDEMRDESRGGFGSTGTN